MREYVITTDNSADFPDGYYAEHGLGCVYLTYTLDGKDYTHENFLPVHDFYETMRNGSMPTTAQANPENIREMMEPYVKEGKDILHIAFSSGLSGTCNSARIAAEELMEDYPERKIIVVDSLCASLGQGMLVYYALQHKEAGEDMDTVAKWVEEHKGNVAHVVTVDDLNHLFRGGRVSRTTAFVGSVLNIKPMLHIDKDGGLVPTGKVRGRKKALQELIKMMDEKIGSYKDSCDTIFVSHGDCEADAQYVIEKVKEKYPVKTVLVNHVGSVIGSHAGPGTVALFFMSDVR